MINFNLAMKSRKKNTTEINEMDDKNNNQATKIEENNGNANLKNGFENLQNEEINYKDKYLRLLAEYTNFVKQQEEEIKKFTLFANKNILLRLMDLLDDLELYLKEDVDNQRKELINFVSSKILQIFELEGVVKLDIKPGDDYNPDFCEVVHVIENSEMQGKIVDVVRNGYKLKDLIIRVAKVVVAK